MKTAYNMHPVSGTTVCLHYANPFSMC